MPLQPLISDPNAPSMANLPPMGGLPQLGAPPLMPLVQNPRMQQEQGLQNRINSYENPQKPQGFWQNVRHIAATIGNDVGNVLAPGEMSLIPGTQFHNALENKGNVRELAGLQNQDTAESTAASENNLRGAQTGHQAEETNEMPSTQASELSLRGQQTREEGDEADALENPKPSYEIHDTPNGPLFVNKATGQAQHLTVDGNPVGPKIATKTVQLEIAGKPHQVLVNDEDGSVIKDLGMSGEKPPTVNVNAGAALGREERNDALKAYQPSLDSAERMNVMTESYVKAIKDHDQQAMLNLLANHLGMTMGLQKGARITKDLYQEAAHSTPWLQKVGAQFDKDDYLSGVTLNPNQMRQMVDLAQSRYQQDISKSRSTAQYLGVKDDGPTRIPSTSTINFYLGKANGDPGKAKALAAKDGWTVQ